MWARERDRTITRLIVTETIIRKGAQTGNTGAGGGGGSLLVLIAASASSIPTRI